MRDPRARRFQSSQHRLTTRWLCSHCRSCSSYFERVLTSGQSPVREPAQATLANAKAREADRFAVMARSSHPGKRTCRQPEVSQRASLAPRHARHTFDPLVCILLDSNQTSTRAASPPPYIPAPEAKRYNNQQGRHHVQREKDQTGYDDPFGNNDNTGPSESDPSFQLRSS